MRTLIAALILIISLGTQAASQMPDVATDQELFAAYCLGVGQEMGKGEPRILTGAPEVDIPAKRDFENATTRLSLYLTARGLTSDGGRSAQAIAGANLATGLGKTDAGACMDQLKRCSRGGGKCPKPGEPADCFKSCMQLESSCVATERCGKENRLPF